MFGPKVRTDSVMSWRRVCGSAAGPDVIRELGCSDDLHTLLYRAQVAVWQLQAWPFESWPKLHLGKLITCTSALISW